jgi:hypothetical protein
VLIRFIALTKFIEAVRQVGNAGFLDGSSWVSTIASGTSRE